MKFNSREVANKMVKWIGDWFKENGENCTAVIGISGGKDSTIAAAACVEALGKNRVLGVLMPDGEQDMQDAIDVIKYLNIEYIYCDIKDIIDTFCFNIPIFFSDQAGINLPARVRMCVLYVISQSINGRVVNTCNKSENWIGYSTIYGDAAGDFSPLHNLLVREVKAVGYELGLPARFIEKIPEDGLCGKTDEEKLGFSYKTLDTYIGDGIEPSAAIKEKIDRLHKQNLFKLQPIASFNYRV